MYRIRGFTLAVLAALVPVLASCAPMLGRLARGHTRLERIHVLPATLAVEDRPYWDRGFDTAYRVALRNLHGPSRFHPLRHAHAAPAMRSVHLWDSAFMSQVWKSWDAEVAGEVIESVLMHAVEGRVPHYSHPLFRTPYTQPPVLAWAAWEGYLWSGDRAWLSRVYPALVRSNDWLYRNRRLASGLFFWQSALESGLDNSPRFDASRVGDDLTGIAAIDLSSYMVLQNESLSRMARALGRPSEERLYRGRTRDLARRINALLWDDTTGFYYDRVEATGEFVRVRSSAGLLPLFAGVPDSTRAARLRDHAVSPAEFNTLIPLPTLAVDDPAFSRDMWRGPVWINLSFMIIAGLDRYGFADEAADLAFRTVDGVYRSLERTGELWEFYDPDRLDIDRLCRKPGEIWKQLSLGNRPLPDYGWTTLVNTLVIEYVVGLRRDEDRRLTLSPRLPAVAGSQIIRLSLPAAGIAVALRRQPDGSAVGEVWVGPRRVPVALAVGEEMVLDGSVVASGSPLLTDTADRIKLEER